MKMRAQHRRKQRGSSMIEAGLVTSVFIIILVGIMDFACMGFALNSVNFAAHRAARYASLRGSSTSHPVTAAEVQTEAKSWIVALDPAALTVNVNWTPDNHPGSTVEVKLIYNYDPMLVPISAATLSLKSTSRQIVVQ
jgi:Flp pilus assembly protein TadG